MPQSRNYNKLPVQGVCFYFCQNNANCFEYEFFESPKVASQPIYSPPKSAPVCATISIIVAQPEL